MNNVKFLPWVGKNYSNGGIFGKRIMVLGESHYCPDDEALPDLTNVVVKAHVSDSPYTTLTKFERSLVGHETDQAERAKIWESILFYNYLQENMSEAREAGTKAQYQKAEKPFFEVLEKYKPEYVIMWGNRLWDNAPSTGFTAVNSVKLDGYEAGDGYYTLKDGTKVKVIAVYHPSAGYDWAWWYRYLKLWGCV